MTLENAQAMARRVRELEKEPSTLVANLWEPTWGWGSLTNKAPQLRRRAIARVCECVEIAKLMGIKIVSVWLGHDGVDHPFRADYSRI